MKLPKIKLPLVLVEWLCARGLLERPYYLCVEVADTPFATEMQRNLLYREVRKTFPKWAHFICPRCGEHIQVPIAASLNNWTLSVDWLGRPTMSPSIWETATCGAHFFLRRGKVDWCPD
jgi:hypothetical protein